MDSENRLAECQTQWEWRVANPEKVDIGVGFTDTYEVFPDVITQLYLVCDYGLGDGGEGGANWFVVGEYQRHTRRGEMIPTGKVVCDASHACDVLVRVAYNGRYPVIDMNVLSVSEYNCHNDGIAEYATSAPDAEKLRSAVRWYILDMWDSDDCEEPEDQVYTIKEADTSA